MPFATKEVVITPYDPRWPQQFEARRQALSSLLGGLPILSIQHVGSTSVEGLAAKAILDIDVVIPSPAEFPAVCQRLEQAGYVHQGDLGLPGRHAFHREETGAMPCHLYVCWQDAAPYREHIAFRDYLRTHEEARQAYQALKILLAGPFRYDPDAYCQHKTDFIRGILQQAQEEQTAQ